jgi:hypothetical protein
MSESSPLEPEPTEWEARIAWWRAKADELTEEGLRKAVPYLALARGGIFHPTHAAYLTRATERAREAGLI